MIYITGDTHGNVDIEKINTTIFPEQKKLTQNDFLIICGDVAVCWDGSKFDRYIQKWYADKNFTTLFIDGNHENFDVLNNYPVDVWNGGKVHIINDKLIHLMRGQVFTIEGSKFFTMGGAASHDKIYRKEHISWWSQEMPDDYEYDEALNNLGYNDNKVNFIITHCAPNAVQDIIGQGRFEHDKLTGFLEIVRSTVEFDHWFMGHYHIDKDISSRYSILYQDVGKIEGEDDHEDIL